MASAEQQSPVGTNGGPRRFLKFMYRGGTRD